MSIMAALSDKGRHAVTTTVDATLVEAMHTLVEFKIGYLVVLDAERHVEGVLSERDIIRALTEKGAATLALRAGELMTAHPITCAPEDEPKDVLRDMNLHGFRHMPVVDKGKVVGIVSSRDIIRHLLEQMGMDVTTITRLQEMGIY